MTNCVFIPTAGIGSRLGNLTKYINKSLISVDNRPVLSHIIDKFSDDTEFVIALGYKGNLIREFLELAYPNKKISLVEVVPFEGTGSGLGLSMLSCAHLLQKPFIFVSCDTIVTEQIPLPDHNWMGYSEFKDLNQYRTIKVVGNYVTDIYEKGWEYLDNNKPYIGISGIHDYKLFWEFQEDGGNDAIIKGESYGLYNLLHKNIKAYKFQWYDTGNIESLNFTQKAYQTSSSPNILEKPDEAIWFVNEKVIKFSNDKIFIENRVKRANSDIRDYVPKIIGSKLNMYSYNRVESKTLSEIITLPLFDKLLEQSRIFWKPAIIYASEYEDFYGTCLHFYKDKTKERIELFYKIFNKKDGTETINGELVPTLKELIDTLDWNWLSKGYAGRFHGDFHFENILFSEEDNKFTFLDWRQDFGGNLNIGDIYYDLAKLNHGLIISHELISENMFSVNWSVNEINYEVYRKQILVECERMFEKWLKINGFSVKKVKILTALIYLNIAALHHYPYSLLLYALGKKMLKQELET